MLTMTTNYSEPVTDHDRSEYAEGFRDGSAEARDDGWTRETFTEWLRMCGDANGFYDAGFRAGAADNLSERGL